MKVYTGFEIKCNECLSVLYDPSSDCGCLFTSNKEAEEACVNQGWEMHGDYHICHNCQYRTRER